MAASRQLRFLAEADLPPAAGALVVRQAWVPPLAAGLLLLTLGLGFSAGLVAAAVGASFGSAFSLAMGIVAGLVVGVVALLSMLVGLLFLSAGLAALRASNWVLRATPEGLYLKLRGYADHRLPAADPVVAFLPRAAIRWLRTHDERVRRVAPRRQGERVEDDVTARQSYLELALEPEDLGAIERALAAERRRQVPTLVPGVTARAKGAPMHRRRDGVLRLDWRTGATRLRPGLDRFVAALGPGWRIAETETGEQAPIATLDADGREARLLEMVQQGNTIDALTLARDLYGLDTTEAKRFLDELAGRA